MLKNHFTQSQKTQAPTFILYPYFLFPFCQRKINANLRFD